MIGLPCTQVGLDPGTANTLIYVSGRGIAVNERTLVTVRAGTGEIEAVGGEAEAGLGRTPLKLRTARPVSGGGISDLTPFDGMLARFLRKARLPGPWRRLRAAVAVPGGMTQVERLAVVESVRNAGAAEVLLVDQVLAAARGAGLPIEEPRGRMVVNIGAGVTDVAVLSLSNTVYTRAARVAGNEMDTAIAEYIRAVYQIIIGESTAERLEIRTAAIGQGRKEPALVVKGRCMRDGLPRAVEIREAEVQEALAVPLSRIVQVIREALEHAPPELSADLIETGIVLTGGSALLRNLDDCISRDCGLPVRVAHDPLSCVIRGLAQQLAHLRSRDWRRFGEGR